MKETEKKFNKKSEAEAEEKVENHLKKVHRAKKAVMKAIGLQDIEPIDNGLWDNHVKLSEADADRIIETFGEAKNLFGRRKKRQGVWFYDNADYKWPNGTIPYSFDPDFSKKVYFTYNKKKKLAMKFFSFYFPGTIFEKPQRS